MDYESLLNLAKKFRNAIDLAQYEIPCGDRMRNFPKGCCDDAADLFAFFLYERYGVLSTIVDGKYIGRNPEDDDWHTWLEVNGYIVDLVAEYYHLFYNDIFVGTTDEFHRRYETKKQVYRGFIDLGEDCQKRMEDLYSHIVGHMS